MLCLPQNLKNGLVTEFQKKTKNATNWAINVWVQWAEQRNCNPTTAMEDYTCVHVDIIRATTQELDFWMARCIMECRRDNGTPYPPNTLVALANGIQRYLRENNRPEINFMQKNSPVFPLFQKGIDAKMKELTEAEIGNFFICIIY